MYKLKENEFLLCYLAYPAVEYNKVKTLFDDCGIKLKSEKVELEIRTYSKKSKNYKKAAYRNIVSLKDFEKCKKLGFQLCKNSFFRETNPSKYSRFNALMRAYNKALKAKEQNIPKTKYVA